MGSLDWIPPSIRKSLLLESDIVKSAPKTSSLSERKSRTVDFFPEVQVFSSEITLTDEDVASSWIQADERDNIKKHVRETVLMMRKGSKLDPRTHCIRGLESCIDPKSALMSRRKARRAVLIEQELQKSEGVKSDPELIALVAIEGSSAHREMGILLGLNDQQGNIKSYPKILAQENKLLAHTPNLSAVTSRLFHRPR